MLASTAKRFCLVVLVALTVSALAFSLLYPSSDPAMALAGEAATEADIPAVRAAYGFDRLIYVQYLQWLVNATQSNFAVGRTKTSSGCRRHCGMPRIDSDRFFLISAANIGRNRSHQALTVSWLTSILRSWSKSSTCRNDSGKRTYIITAKRMISGEVLK